MPKVPLALILCALISQSIFVSDAKQSKLPDYSGFDENLLVQMASGIENGAFVGSGALFGNVEIAKQLDASVQVFDRDALFPATVIGNPAKPSRSSIVTYTVKKGDTALSLAEKYGISVDTILWANNLKADSALKAGQKLFILPVSGVLYVARAGDSAETIANLYNVAVENVMIFSKNKSIKAGNKIAVAYAKPIVPAEVVAVLPRLSNEYFIEPVKNGWNWGVLHEKAVDISAACGAAVFAAHDGVVAFAGEAKESSAAYVNYVAIQHDETVQAIYGNVEKSLVKVGDRVKQGEVIGYLGASARTNGSVGCHLHFAVLGAQNPFAK